MNKTELFDKILKALSEKPDSHFDLYDFYKKETSLINDQLIDSIYNELFDRNWVDSLPKSKKHIQINYNGQQIIEKYGSYSSFFRDLKKSDNKEQVQKRTDRTLTIISKISAIFFGLTSFILGYNKFFVDDLKIDNQQTEIKKLNGKVDSLKFELKKRTTTPYKKNAVDSAKTKG